jgi:hypothetical protein
MSLPSPRRSGRDRARRALVALGHTLGRRQVVEEIAALVVETAIFSDLMRRSDLSRAKARLWYMGIDAFPRLGTVAYVAARPQTKLWVARVRAAPQRMHLAR